MKLTFDSATMAQQLTVASRVLNNKSSFPILDCYLFEVAEDGSHVAITASDSENTLRIACPLVVFEPDADAAKRRFCVKARLIMDALKEIPAQPVILTINMQTMEIRGDYANGRFDIVGESADGYPEPPVMGDNGVSVSLPSEQLIKAIESTQFVLADDEIRPVMTGIFFDWTPEQLTCVGTNGKVLVRRSILGGNGVVTPSAPTSFIMPKKAAAILRALTAKLDSAVDITFTENHLLARTGAFELHARLIDGRYPNYNSVIPKGNPYTASISTTDLIPALRRVLTFANKDSSLVRLTLTAGALRLSCIDVDYSMSAEETIRAEWNGPDGSLIGAKGSILLDVLAHLPGEVNISLSEPNRPMIFTPAEQDRTTTVLMLVMPMQLSA